MCRLICKIRKGEGLWTAPSPNEVIPSAATPPRDFSALALFSHDVPDSADPPAAEQYSRGPTNKDLSYEIRGRGSGIRRRERERRGYVTGYFSGGGGAIACTPKHSAVTRKSGKLVLPPPFPDRFGRNLGEIMVAKSRNHAPISRACGRVAIKSAHPPTHTRRAHKHKDASRGSFGGQSKSSPPRRQLL